jgi:manganese oxidase
VSRSPVNIETIQDAVNAVVSRRESRRSFLRNGAVAAVTGTLVAACKPAAASERSPGPVAKAAVVSPPVAFGADDVSAASIASADAMDKMHEAGIKAFPAKSKGRGNQLLAPRIERGVKVFDLVAKRMQWETEPGKVTEAWAYNGMVPGPMIRVRAGERVRVNIRNELPESTSIHFHGVELANSQDGVPCGKR